MSRALSIHIGVNRPSGRMGAFPLLKSEKAAWLMAGLAHQAGYDSMLVLRGPTATRQAVHTALTAAAGMLREGDSLLVTFSGHGKQERDLENDDRGGVDEGWCLADGVLLDDRLAGYWRLFERGVRIIVVSESCYSGGMDRDDEDWENTALWGGGGEPAYRGDAPSALVRSCIAEPSRETHGILATVLLLTASRKEQVAREGLFTQELLAVWNNGAFERSYCELHREVRERVMAECDQEPQILMTGSGDVGFALERAFRVDPGSREENGDGYRAPGDDHGVVYREAGDDNGNGYRESWDHGRDGYRD